MYKALPAREKIRLIRQVKNGKSISKICKQYKISRTIFYKWCKKYSSADKNKKHIALFSKIKKGYLHWKSFNRLQEERLLQEVIAHPEYSAGNLAKSLSISPYGAWSVLNRYDLNTIEKRKIYALKNKKEGKKKQIDINDKLQAFKKYEAGESVVSICKEYKISRQIFYIWYKRYKEASKHVSALEAKRPKGQGHWRYVPYSEKLTLELVAQHPEYTPSELSHVLYIKHRKKILGAHGIYNLLKRHGLNLYSDRVAYSKRIKSFGRQQLFSSFNISFPGHSYLRFIADISPPSKIFANERVKFFGYIFLASFVFSLLSLHSVTTILSSGSLGRAFGLFFAYISLAAGMFFLLYSMKYYLSIAIVLSWSRRDGRYKNIKRGWGEFFAGIFGVSINVEDEHKESGMNYDGETGAFGLMADLSGVVLQSNPFVSIHVSTYNEKRVIDRLLTSCTSFDYPNYEVIVADDSDDETIDLINKWKHHPRIKISHRETRDGFKGAALSQALKMTDKKAQFVLVFDADFIPYPDTITQFLKYFQLSVGAGEVNDSNIAAVQGYQWHILNKSENWITRGIRSEYSGSYVIERSGSELYKGLKQISGSVYMIKRDVLESVGWGRSITEDFELTLKLYSKGYKVVYTPYVQSPAEAVSTVKRLIRQRMRWAEGHSYNIKKMFTTLFWGRWIDNKKKVFVHSPLTLSEKLEFIYLVPYYLQAALFILGTISWFLAETVFQVRLPFWTEIWGWTLVATNMFALPLMNMIGMFMEESEKRDYMGLLSFVALSYIVAPFQAYAAVKGFLEKEEGPWFRTPKTGRITDSFMPGRIARFVKGILGRPATLSQTANPKISLLSKEISHEFRLFSWIFDFVGMRQGSAELTGYKASSYLALLTANNPFNSFRIKRKKTRWLGNLALLIFIISSLILTNLAPLVPQTTQASKANFRSLLNEKEFNTQKSPLPRSVEIKEPLVSMQAESVNGESFEYIFHPEPRVRVKLGHRELEMKLLGSYGLGELKLKKATKSGNIYSYDNVFDDVDLNYKVERGNLQEEFILKKYKEVISIDEEVRLQGLVMSKINDEIQIAPKEGGSSIFTFGKPFMFEQKSPLERNFGVRFELVPGRFGWKVSKVLTEEGKRWLADPKRNFPVVIDPTMVQSSSVTSGITEAETDLGSIQRKVVYSDNSSAWYAFNQDGNTINYKKCLVSAGCESDADWGASVRVSTDTSGQGNPSVWFQRAGTGDGMIFVAWIDDSSAVQATLDSLAFRTVNTASSDALGTQCNSADQGSIAITDRYAYIAAGNNGDVLVGYGRYSGIDTELDVFEVPTGGCTFTSIETNSGLATGKQSVAVVPFEVATNRIVIIYNDAGGNADQRESQFNISNSTWNFSDNDVDGSNNVSTFTFSAVSDGSDIWVLRADSATSTDIFRCATCTGDTAHTWTTTDAVPWSSQTNITEVSLSYIATSPSNTLVAMILKDTTNEQAYFKTTDADTISWGTEYSFGFTAGDNGNLSSTFYVDNDSEVGVVMREASAYSFSTLPENLWLMMLAFVAFVVLKNKNKRGFKRLFGL